MSHRIQTLNMTHITNLPLHNNWINTDNTNGPVSHQSPDLRMAPHRAKSNPRPSEDTRNLERIVVTYKSLRFEMFCRKDGKWVIVSPAKRRPNYSRRRVGNKRAYVEALRRKKLRESTAFGRLRRGHIQEMHSHRHKKLDLQKVRQLYKTQTNKV